MTASLKSQTTPDGMPGWAWPVLGLVGGLVLVLVVHGTCFVDPKCN